MTTWVLDLDGVVWLGKTAIPGASEAVARLRGAGLDVAFCTNNSSRPIGDYEAKLERFGIEAADAVVSSATAVAGLVAEGERALVCAGPGVVEALVEAGASVALAADEPEGPFDAVVVGFHPTFDYRSMRSAMRAVLGGARLLATNNDPIYPSDDGPAPGCGSILASIERSTGTEAVLAGKPTSIMASVVRDRFGDDGVFVGDSLTTDGAMATELGWPFGLVLSGNVGAADVPEDHPPDWLAADLADLVTLRLGL